MTGFPRSRPGPSLRATRRRQVPLVGTEGIGLRPMLVS
jgi:hypothetical protein